MARPSIFHEHLSDTDNPRLETPRHGSQRSVKSSGNTTRHPFDNVSGHRRFLPGILRDDLRFDEKLKQIPSRMKSMGARSMRSIRRWKSTTGKHIPFRKTHVAEEFDSQVRLPISNSVASFDRRKSHRHRVDVDNTLATIVACNKPAKSTSVVIINNKPKSRSNFHSYSFHKHRRACRILPRSQKTNRRVAKRQSDDADETEIDPEIKLLQLYIELLVMRNFPLSRWERGQKVLPYKKGPPLATIPETPYFAATTTSYVAVAVIGSQFPPKDLSLIDGMVRN
ncbi:hypothetical protein VTN77DRAFT_4748 [Rasamsonia byssochlamydoides]|uniref:uncharacterized protein n=1 Tax=Rasamsonia byssochlamydoides TaxID=89139 RepID=UPI0037442257